MKIYLNLKTDHVGVLAERKVMQNFSAMRVFVSGRLYVSGHDVFLSCFGQASEEES